MTTDRLKVLLYYAGLSAFVLLLLFIFLNIMNVDVKDEPSSSLMPEISNSTVVDVVLEDLKNNNHVVPAESSGKQSQVEIPSENPDSYKLGVYSSDNDNIQESFGSAISDGLPNLIFDYGDNWFDITQNYFKEIDIIWNPARSKWLLVEWIGSEHRVKEMNAISVHDYISSLGVYFSDKMKNRKDEFHQNSNLENVYHVVMKKYFPDWRAEDVHYFGVMPKSEVNAILQKIKNIDTSNGQRIVELKLKYIKVSPGVYDISLESL